MKRTILALSAMMAMGFTAAAQNAGEVDIETSDVQLEMITPAQPVQETEQEIKEREKKLRELYDDVAYAKASNSMRRGYFVLVADNVQIGNMGYRHYDINRNSNFILVQDEDGIIQFALNTGVSGANGLGGWTGHGKVRNKRLTYDKNGDVYLQYQLISSGVNADVHITLFHNSKRAVATITGGAPITLYGEILPYRDKKHR
jgi:hypothetical protein